MGRLFWKFFSFIWLAQLTTILAVSAMFWVERNQDEARWRAMMAASGVDAARWGHGPGMGPPPPVGSGHKPPPGSGPPPFGHRRLIPLEPLVATLFGSLIFAALLAWYFSKPIRSLRAAFAAVAEGNLDPRLGPSMGGRRDELADLGRNFDAMASHLRALMDGQRRLLHDVSHELRSPLARLQAAIGLARQQPDKLDASLQRIERESVRMDRLVGELLTLSRLEAGVTGSLEDEVDMGELLSGVVDDARFEAEAKGCRVEFDACGVALVRGRAELLHRAIENVLRNAVRHTPEGGSVRVETLYDAKERQWRLEILDQGPGVAEKDLGAIFEPFFRGGGATGGEGHGLGLAIARRVVLAHGGTICASNRPGGGLRVEIALPLIASRGGSR